MIVQVKDVESLLLEVSNLKTEVARHKFNANQAQQDLQMLGPKIEELRARIAKLEWPKDAVVC